uniref:Chromo domain-containing protein n=1 Tax=Mesocestoides corti TaxID=53468 RepID=A0A5K3FHT7_MESCO
MIVDDEWLHAFTKKDKIPRTPPSVVAESLRLSLANSRENSVQNEMSTYMFQTDENRPRFIVKWNDASSSRKTNSIQSVCNSETSFVKSENTEPLRGPINSTPFQASSYASVEPQTKSPKRTESSILETEDGARMTKGSSEASDTKPDVAGYSTGLSHPEFNACDREETSRVAQSPARSTNLEFCQSEDIEAITSSSDGLPSTVSTFEPPVTAAEVACVPRSKEPFASEMNSFASTPECRDARSCHLEPTRVTAKRRRVPDDSETPQTSPNKVQNQPVPRSHRKRLKHPAETTVDASKPMYNLRHTASRLRTRDTPNDPAIVSSVRAAVVVDDDDAATQAVKKRRRRTRRQSKVKARVCIDADHEVSPPRQANRRRTLRNVPRVNYAEL